MPLCPQITNTPITVSLTSDFTVTNVVPVLAANTEQLAEVDADTQQALIDAQIAQNAADAAAAVAASSAAAAAAAQASATAANATAASAVTTANSAASAAAAAQSTASTANATAIAANTAAGVAQTTADGKNKVTYSTSAPGSTANALGDIWFQYGTSAPNVGRIIAQFTGNGGTSWTQTTISGLVIANIDAGNITTGTLTAAVGISNPSGNFSVNGATGALFATSATITGEVNALSGYFGTLTNGFSINSTGLVGVGSGTIVGGIISGTQFTNGGTFSVSPTGFLQASAGTIGGLTLSGSSIASATGGFSVTSAGVLTAISGTIGGLTLASNSISSATGGFSVTSAGVLTASSGTIGGFTLSGTGLTAGASLSIQTTGTITGGNSQTIFYGFANIGGGSATGARLIVAGTSELNGNVAVLGNITATNSVTFGASSQQFEFLSSSGNVRVAQSYSNSVSGRAMQISSAGLYGTTASTQRKKHEIESYKINSSALLALDVKRFKYKPEIDEAQQVQHGFIAEEAQALGLDELIQYDSTGEPDYFAYEKLPIFLLQLVQELKAEIDQLKGA